MKVIGQFVDQAKSAALGPNMAYATAQAQSAMNQPRELRLSERLNGIEGALSELIGKLKEAHHRLEPFPEGKSDTDCAQQSGVKPSIARIEDYLREANSLANGLMNVL